MKLLRITMALMMALVCAPSDAQVTPGRNSLANQNADSVAITGGTIIGLPTPLVGSAAANKTYVDSAASGLTLLPPSTLATNAVLPNTPTYANGALGVGATLTAGSNTTLTVDSTAAPLNTVVLVKDQASAFQNGIYTVTAAGSGGAPWVLTRATYFDQAAEMKAGSYTFITSGVVSANSAYTLQAAVTTVGTDPLSFILFSRINNGVGVAPTPQGRLTLASLTPVMGSTSCASAPCTNQTTIYYDCYAGCGVPTYNGTNVTSQQIPNEVSDALPNAGAGVANANDVFDLWWNAATGALCHVTNGAGAGWSADTGGSITARGTGYTQLSRSVGFLVNANSLTHCYNGAADLGPIAASRATYLGTFATTGAAGTVSYTFGSGVSGGGAALFGLWNYYNRVTVTTNVSDISAPYTYTTLAYRQAGGSAGNQIQFVLGVAEDNAAAIYSAEMTTTATINAAAVIGVGFDSSSAPGCQPGLVFSQSSATVAGGTSTVNCAWQVTAGVHTLYALERGDGFHANTFNSISANNLSFSLDGCEDHAPNPAFRSTDACVLLGLCRGSAAGRLEHLSRCRPVTAARSVLHHAGAAAALRACRLRPGELYAGRRGQQGHRRDGAVALHEHGQRRLCGHQPGQQPDLQSL
jgi:hypothetical protein